MAVKASLNLQIDEFEAKYRKAVAQSKRYNNMMERDARDSGKAMGTGLTKGMSNLGAGIGIAGIGAAIKSSLQWADDIADLTQKLNENAETIQRVDFVAQQAASVGVEQISKAMLKLEDNLGDVANTRVTDALGRIGMSAEDLIGLPLDEKLMALSKAFQNARATGVGVADMTELVGRQAAELIPLLNLSQEALEGMFSEAPALADQAIQRMAELNDQFDAMVLKSKAGVAQQVDEAAEWGRIIKDIFTTGSIDQAVVNSGERSVEAEQARITREEARKAQAEAVESSRAQVEADKEQAAAAKELEGNLKAIKDLRDSMEDAKIDLLPDPEKLEVLKQKLQDAIEEATDGTIFRPSIEGVEDMANSRQKLAEDNGLSLDSTVESLERLEQLKALKERILDLQKSIAKEREDSADAEKQELTSLREEAAEGEFELLNPEEQAAKLRDQLSGSLGFDINGLADVEKGLKEAREKVEAARESGDTEAEKAALESLTDAQGKAKDLAKLNLAGDSEEQSVNGRGTVAGAIANIFGRSSSDLQLDEAKMQTTALGNIERVLKEIRDEDASDPFTTGFTSSSFP